MIIIRITNNIDPRLITDIYLKRLEKKEKIEQNTAAEVKKNNAQKDSLEISELARELQVYQARLKDLPETRSDVIKAIKEKLSKGTYQTDAIKIAEGIIDEYQLDNSWGKKI